MVFDLSIRCWRTQSPQHRSPRKTLDVVTIPSILFYFSPFAITGYSDTYQKYTFRCVYVNDLYLYTHTTYTRADVSKMAFDVPMVLVVLSVSTSSEIANCCFFELLPLRLFFSFFSFCIPFLILFSTHVNRKGYIPKSRSYTEIEFTSIYVVNKLTLSQHLSQSWLFYLIL